MKNMKYVVSILLLIVSVCVRSQSNNNLPPYRELIADCHTFVVPPAEYEQVNYLYGSDFYKKITALSKNDILAYYGKSGLEGLDQELYLQSEQYKTDRAEFQQKKQEKYALLANIWNSSSNTQFDADGIVFYDWGSVNLENFKLTNYYIDFCRILFPVQSIRTTDNRLKFKCSDIQLLQKVRSQNQKLSVLFIFKPMSSVLYDAQRTYFFHVVNPIAIYLVDNTTGEILMDLSKSIRRTNFQSEKQRITNGVKTYNATQRRNAPKKHDTPQMETCAFCNGSGIEHPNTGAARRCYHCAGKGYNMTYYY